MSDNIKEVLEYEPPKSENKPESNAQNPKIPNK